MLAACSLGCVACKRSSTPNGAATGSPSIAPAPPASLVLEVSDEAGTPLPSRVHLRDEHGQVVVPGGWPSFNDHFVFAGKAVLPLPAGSYTFEIERGPEYRAERGTFRVDAPKAELRVKLSRIANLVSEGFYPGDLHVHRRPEDIELLMRAEDLSVGPVVTWGNEVHEPVAGPRLRAFDAHRIADLSAGEDERYGGALLFFRLEKPFELPPSAREDGKIVQKPGIEGGELPSALSFAERARSEPKAHVDIEKPFWWDVPLWLSRGVVDSVGIAHNHMNRSGSRNHEAWGRRCDRSQYGESPLANGFCTQDIYYRMLETGLRLAPSAGSASGVLPNPVGYNRVYVHVEPPFTEDGWWRGLKRGESFVTNGPLLLVKANDRRPGEVFRGKAGDTLTIELGVTLRSATPIRSVELVRDGKVAARGAWDPASGSVKFSPISFTASGWFLVRALTDRTDTFRFASTAPFYVEIGGAARVSRAAAKYFETWVGERIVALQESGIDPTKLEPIIAEEQRAERYFSELAARANAN